MKFSYEWKLTDLDSVPRKKIKVFSCFAGGGGSSMGYKMSGCDVIGMNEIDPRMAKSYCANLSPKYSFIEPIQTFVKRNDLPKELFNLDILDGSPPCSTFSRAGNREKDWKKEKVFAEGQKKQVLSELFFDFIDLVEKLRPKVVIAENVKGLIAGRAKEYVRKIRKKLEAIGYRTQLFLFNSARMGVPQARERVFFIATRMNFPSLRFDFNERPIVISDFFDKSVDLGKEIKGAKMLDYWKRVPVSENFNKVAGPGKYFSHRKLSERSLFPTMVSALKHFHWDEPRHFSNNFYRKCSSFPADYDFKSNPAYAMGMSVPPIMMNRIVDSVLEQWFL